MPRKKTPPASEFNGEQEQEEEKEEEKEELEPLRVPSAAVVPQPQALLLAHTALQEGIAAMRAALGITNESEEEELGPSRGLSAAIVRRRHTMVLERNLQDALARLQATDEARRLAHANLLSWQENDQRLAHRQETVVEARRASEQRHLREAVAVVDRVYDEAQQAYRRAFADSTPFMELFGEASSEEDSESDGKQEEEGEEEEEKQEQAPPRTLSAPMVWIRQRRQMQIQQRAQAHLAAAELGSRLSRANLSRWQANNAKRVHSQEDTKTLTSNNIEEGVLRTQINMWEDAIADARRMEQRASSEASSELHRGFDSENPKTWSDPINNSSDDSSDLGKPSRADKKEANMIDDSDTVSSKKGQERPVKRTMSSVKEEERPGKRAKLTKARLQHLNDENMRHLRGRRYQTRETQREIQRQIELDHMNATLKIQRQMHLDIENNMENRTRQIELDRENATRKIPRQIQLDMENRTSMHEGLAGVNAEHWARARENSERRQQALQQRQDGAAI
jgi:hypothetical protein